MANGVVCPHCKTDLEGKIKRGDIIDCPQCYRRFNVTNVDLERYKKSQVKPVAVNIAGSEPVLQQKKKMPKWAILLIAFFGLGLLGNIIGGTRNNNSSGANSETSATPVADSTTPKKEEAKAKDDDSKYFSSWDGSNRELVYFVKQNMKDPDSFEHVETRFNDNGSSYDILMKYRGKNSFNATVTQAVTAHFDKTTRQLSNVEEVK